MITSPFTPLHLLSFISEAGPGPVREKVIRDHFEVSRTRAKELLDRCVSEEILRVSRKGRERVYEFEVKEIEASSLRSAITSLAVMEDEWRDGDAPIREQTSGETPLEMSGSISRFLDHMVFLEETASIILASLEELDFSKVFLETFKRLFFAVDYDIGIALTVETELKAYMICKKGVDRKIKDQALRSAREMLNLVIALPFVPSEHVLLLDVEEKEESQGGVIMDKIGVSFERDRMTPGLLVLFRLTNSPFLADEKQVLDVLSSQISLACININAIEKIHQQAITDELTGLSNKRDFQNKFTREFERANRYDYPLSICMMDLDHFKSINDRFGHHQGDVVLSEVAAILLRTVKVRVSDILARYGGEEFVLLLPHTELNRACEVAEKIRSAIEANEFPGEATTIRCTLSLGVAELNPKDVSPEQFLTRADVLLYKAKAQGRNLVISE